MIHKRGNELRTWIMLVVGDKMGMKETEKEDQVKN